MPRGIVLSIYLGCTEFSAAESICRTAPPSSVHASPLPQPSSQRRVTLRSIILLSYRSCSPEKQSAQITRRQERPVSILVSVCSQSCCAVTCSTAVKCLSLICSHSLIMHVYLMFLYTESSFLFISHWFTRSDLCMNEWQSYTHTEACVMSQWGHKHTNIISRTALRVTSWVFHRFIWVKAFHILIPYTQECKGIHATPQNKSQFFWRPCSRNICSAECTYYF